MLKLHNGRLSVPGLFGCRSVRAEEPPMSPEDIARAFHETYERLAPQYGHETREDSRKPWASVPARNRGLMIAVVSDLIQRSIIASGTASNR